MKLLKKSTLLLLTMIITIYSLIPPKVVKAASVDPNYTSDQKKVGDSIADVAINFFNNHADKTIYDYNISDGYRDKAYQNIITESGYALHHDDVTWKYFTDKYPIDCVGFVSMIIHCATGLGNDTFTIFGQPTAGGTNDGRHANSSSQFISLPGSQVKAGDIICTSGHVALAISSNEMIDSAAGGPNWEITRRNIPYSTNNFVVVRVNNTTAQDIVNGGSLRSTWYDGSAGTNYVYKYISNSTEYYYNGMPVTGQYLGHTDDNWLINLFEDIIDWLVGILTMGYKIQIVGWTTIIQNLITSTVNSIASEDMQGAITTEKILFNQIPILDINFFNLNSAGGENISADHVIYMLRSNIASLYYSIRSIAIIVMLVILLYVGIRMALSTLSSDKAKYKQMFLGWCVGFIIIMFIHYFMLVVINLNSQVIDWMASPTGNAIEIYDEVRSYAYEIPASKGWTGAIMYVFLVYYMIKLLLFYFKRLLIVDILAIISPIIGISYAIEMIKGKSKTIKTWMKEFSINVLIQSIHVITYGVFMNIIYEFMGKVNIKNMIPYIVIMILILNLLLKSEKIIKTIFGLKSNTAKDVIQTAIGTSATLATGVMLTTPIRKFVTKQAGKAYENNINKQVNSKYTYLENSKEDINQSELATDIQRQIDKLKEIEANQIKQVDKNAIKHAGNILHGITGVLSAGPIAFETGPEKGAMQLASASVMMNATLGQIPDLKINKERIEELAEKYGVEIKDYNSNPPSFGLTQGGEEKQALKISKKQQKENKVSKTKNTVYTSVNNNTGTNNMDSNNISTNSNEKRAFNMRKVSKHRVAKITGAVGHLATAGTTTRVGRMLSVGKMENEKINNPYLTAQIEILYKMQTQVLQQEGILNNSINRLKTKGFPPVFYEPQPGENESTIATNEMLRDRFKKELRVNLEQAIKGETSVSREQVINAVEKYTTARSINTVKYADLKGILKEVAEQTGYDVGQDFENNMKETVAKDLLNIVQNNKKEANFDSEVVSKEVLEKVESILKSRDWNEDTSMSAIKTIVTNDLQQEIVQKLTADQLNSILNTAINKKGSLKAKPVSPEFKEIVDNATKVAETETEIAEITGEEFDVDELIDTILNEDTVSLSNSEEV